MSPSIGPTQVLLDAMLKCQLVRKIFLSHSYKLLPLPTWSQTIYFSYSTIFSLLYVIN